MKTVSIISSIALLGTLVLVSPAFADETTSMGTTTTTTTTTVGTTSPTMKKSTTVAATTPKTSMPTKIVWQDEAGMVKHLNEHVTYPATGEQLISVCNNLSDVPTSDKEAFVTKMTSHKMHKYASATEVLKTLNSK